MYDRREKAEFPTLHEVADDHVARAIQLTRGDLKEAAKLLGVARSTLYRKFRVTAMTERAREQSMRLRLKKRLDRLRAVTEVAASQVTKGEGGNVYDHGVANGLILARHIMEGRRGEPAYV